MPQCNDIGALCWEYYSFISQVKIESVLKNDPKQHEIVIFTLIADKKGLPTFILNEMVSTFIF